MRKGFGMFKKFLTLIWLFLFFSSTFAVAAPTVASAQREVDKLRTLAAAKYEAANEATIRIKQLQAETTLLRKKEEGLRKELDASAKFLAQIAIARFKENGLGQSLELLFSADPTKYLSDASTLEVLSRGYSEQLRQFEINKQRVEASQLVVSDRTVLLKIQQPKLNREVTQAKAALQRAEKILKSLKKEDRERLAAAEAARESRILQESKKYATSYKGDNSRGSIALKYALQQVGDIYVWAAAGPTRWDCSGLTMRAFQKAGVSLPHSSRIQVRYGKSISYGSLKPGDLVFFGKPISHVSIYMGGGKMVQAPRPGKRVEVVAMTKKFGSKPFVAARRL
jgi:cell wall-associated NlpC family hydrolase